jgi:hypothetical protein
MLQETIVIFSCLYNVGCNDTSSYYANYNPDTKKQFELIESRINNKLNKKFKNNIIPVLLVLKNRQINININSNMILNISSNNSLLLTLTIGY